MFFCHNLNIHPWLRHAEDRGRGYGAAAPGAARLPAHGPAPPDFRVVEDQPQSFTRYVLVHNLSHLRQANMHVRAGSRFKSRLCF